MATLSLFSLKKQRFGHNHKLCLRFKHYPSLYCFIVSGTWFGKDKMYNFSKLFGYWKPKR